MHPTARGLGELQKALWVPMEALGLPYPDRKKDAVIECLQIAPIQGMPVRTVALPFLLPRRAVSSSSP